MTFGLVMSYNTTKNPTYQIRNINYLKHWLLQFYTFTLWRTLFERTKRHTIKWTTDHPPLPGNREEKALAGVILQWEVLVRNKGLTSYHQPGFWRGQKEIGDCSPEVLATSQDPPLWNPSRLSDACAPRKDPNSEWLERDKPETNPMTINPETVSHVAEQFSPFPSSSCPPPRQPFPMQSLALTALLTTDNSFPSVRQESILKPWKGSSFLHQNHNPGENIFQMLHCREGNGTPSSILASEIPETEELGGLQSTAGHFWGEETVPGKLRHSPKAPELWMTQPELWLRTPSGQASWYRPLSSGTCVEN